jgi:pimeloyl-ACP methyl ester carboxylesterase
MQALRLDDGRTLVVHDSGRGGALTLLWHHGTPQTGALLAPLVEHAAKRDVRVISYARPSYGGSTPHRGRAVADAAADVEAIADAMGLGRFATMGASGGGPHALACAALVERVSAAVSIAGPAPLTERFDWYAGMVAPEALRAAALGRQARESIPPAFNPDSFIPADYEALEVRWKALGEDAGRAGAAGDQGAVDDDLAYTSPWGFDLEQVITPVLLVHGGEDRVIPPAHAQHLLQRLPHAELWLRPRDGHVSILDAVPVALDWLLAHEVLKVA